MAQSNMTVSYDGGSVFGYASGGVVQAETPETLRKRAKRLDKAERKAKAAEKAAKASAKAKRKARADVRTAVLAIVNDPQARKADRLEAAKVARELGIV